MTSLSLRLGIGQGEVTVHSFSLRTSLRLDVLYSVKFCVQSLCAVLNLSI